jgi:hypothetical protein
MLLFKDIHVLIEMAGRPDCRFLGTWLMKAAEAQTLWSQALCDPEFEAATSVLWGLSAQPDFECAALETVTALRQQDPPFNGYAIHFVLAVDLDDWESGVFGVEFAMMVQLGFFTFADQSYQLTTPESVTIEKVRQAALKVASTATDGGPVQYVEPERLLHTLPQKEAEAWRSWLIQKHRFDTNDLGEMRAIGDVRISLSHAGFRILDRLPLGDKWARWGAIVVTGRSGSGPS